MNFWDIHNHILPGIDDGSSSADESLEMIGAEYRQGVKNIIFTPHYRKDMFTVPADVREETYRQFAALAAEYYPDMNFYLGCELHVQPNIEKLLADPRCRMADTEICLLEFSYEVSYNKLIYYIQAAIDAGCRPIVAHAERCSVLCEEPEKALALRHEGAMIQVNADTILEGFLSKKRKFAMNLLEEGAVDFIASDAHGMSYRPVRMGECRKVLEKKFGKKTVKDIFIKNPKAAFAGRG